jgi:conjugal transfer/entry exclusion protein
MRQISVVLVCLALIVPSFLTKAEAQLPFLPGGPGLPVYDAANHVQNTITAVQAVLIVLNQLIELTALGGILDYAEDLALLAELASEASAIGFDLASLQSQILVFFDIANAPATSFEYAGLAFEIRSRISQAYMYAMRVQTLINTALRTVEHILAFMAHVGEAIGNLTVSQSLGEAQSKLAQLATEANVRQAAFERGRSLEGAEAPMLIQSIRNINDAQMADHPR